ncbi:MAG: AAA family ATPase [Massilia sp.]
MLQRLYASNFRCFQKLELNLDCAPSSLLIGSNGSGKSTVASVLQIFQQIGRGVSKLDQLLGARDFMSGHAAEPIRLGLDVELDGRTFSYSLDLALVEGLGRLRVLGESVGVDGRAIFLREQADVALWQEAGGAEVAFSVGCDQVALSSIQGRSEQDSLGMFRRWLERMVVLAPQPRQMRGESVEDTLQPDVSGANLVGWLAGLLSQFPAACATLDGYLRELLPDLQGFHDEVAGSESKRLLVDFEKAGRVFTLPFEDLSDGEKCFFLGATIVAANRAYGPLLCFWDAPDNFIALHEVGHFIVSLRRAFQNKGQLIVTSHNEETILKFSDQNTWLLGRESHVEPPRIRTLAALRQEKKLEGDLMRALIAGEVSV